MSGLLIKSTGVMSLIISSVAYASDSQLVIDWYTIDGGGGYSSGGGLELEGTIGQPDAGTSSNGNLVLNSGFWNLAILCSSIDADSDGVDSCTDCNDNNSDVFPGNTEIRCDEIDNDCNPATLDNPNEACTVQDVILAAQGPRYLEVTPADGAVPVALRVFSEDAPCLLKYIDFDPDGELAAEGVSTLVDAPVYRLPSEWGTRFVRSMDIVPDYRYSVQPEVEGVGTVAQAATFKTFLHGDVDNSGVANLADAQLVVLGFQNNLQTPRGAVDLAPCTPNTIVNFEDIQYAIFGFQNQTYGAICPLPCEDDGATAATDHMQTQAVSLKLHAEKRLITAGETIEVRVLISHAPDRHTAQIAVDAQGGDSGNLELVDAWIEYESPDAAMANLSILDATNLTQSVTGAASLDGPVAVTAESHLATFMFEASPNAAGTFTVSIPDDENILILNHEGQRAAIEPAQPLTFKIDDSAMRTPSLRKHNTNGLLDNK
ncbi:MAG: putative metal-binding motif-containing protein [Phycisphaerae bacterium]